MTNKTVVGIDFDNTIIVENYPDIGKLFPYSRHVINSIINSGNEVIIWSCRESGIKEFLDSEGIFYTAINENTSYLIDKYKTNPRKIGADIFIDDKNIFSKEIDWLEIEKELILRKVITVF